MSQFMAPSSYGEALDRLTILELKLEFIQDNRRQDVQREYDDLKSLLKEMLQKDPYHYQKLLEVNRIMWNLQEELHSGSLTDKEKEYNMMKQLAVENQRRFRLKRTLNEFLGSRHREQKGYKGKRCFVLPHQGMGDHLFINGAVRFLATYFDEVRVVVVRKYLENLKLLYINEPAVAFHVIDNDSEISPNFGAAPEKLIQALQGMDQAYLLGFHGLKGCPDFPLSFYDDMNMSREIMMKWSFVPSTKAAPSEPFVFYHNKASNSIAQIPVDLEGQLVINPTENMYPVGHRFWAAAEEWVGLPFFAYTEVIQKAQQVLVVDSSFFCMSLLLGVRPEVWTRNQRTYKNVVDNITEHYYA